MKIRNVLIALAAVAVFSVSAFGDGLPGDTWDKPLQPNDIVDLNEMTFTPGDPQGSCWSGDPDLNNAWYIFEVLEKDQVRITTKLSGEIGGFDSSFVVVQGQKGAWLEVGCSEDDASKGLSPWLGDICLELQPGTYYVVLSVWEAGAYGPYKVDVVIGKHGVLKDGQTCGDGVVNSPCEECEADGDCPKYFRCDDNCKCYSAIPMLPAWGLVGLGVLLVAGGATVFGRRRK